MREFVRMSPLYFAKQWIGDNDFEFENILNDSKFKDEFTVKRFIQIETGREHLRIETVDFKVDLEVGDWFVIDRNEELSSYPFHKFVNGFHEIKKNTPNIKGE